MSVYDDFRDWVRQQAEEGTHFPNLGGTGGGFTVVIQQAGQVQIQTGHNGALLYVAPDWIVMVLKRMIDCGDKRERLMVGYYGNNWPECPSPIVCPFLACLAAYYLGLKP